VLSVVAMRVHNPDRSPFATQRGQAAPTPTAFAEVVSDYFVRPRLLLLGVDYENRDGDLRTSIKRDIAEAARLAHLRFQRGP
jgi:hypothetical protein